MTIWQFLVIMLGPALVLAVIGSYILLTSRARG